MSATTSTRLLSSHVAGALMELHSGTLDATSGMTCSTAFGTVTAVIATFAEAPGAAAVLYSTVSGSVVTIADTTGVAKKVFVQIFGY